MSNLRDLSKNNYEPPSCCAEWINAGSLQRIADATELMAKNHAQLIAERDRYERGHKTEQAQRQKAERSNAALRGVVTKLENRVAELTRQLNEARWASSANCPTK